MKKINVTIICLFMFIFFNSCVQKTKNQIVKFYVDTNGIENINSVGVRGQIYPLNWNKNFELNDKNSDKIYEGEITFDIPFDFVELKFVKNQNQFELLDQPNRRVYFDASGNTEFSVRFDENK